MTTTFADRIAAHYAAGTLVVGWTLDPVTEAKLNEIKRFDTNGTRALCHWRIDNDVLFEGGPTIRTGWTSGAPISTSVPAFSTGDEGGTGLVGFREMQPLYGSPGAPYRFGRNSTFAIQWVERYNAGFMGLASGIDRSFKGGVKTQMIDLESRAGKYGANSMMEIVATSDHGSKPLSAWAPGNADITTYGMETHGPIAAVPAGGSLAWKRIEKWVGYTLEVNLGATWAVNYAVAQRTAPTSDPFYILNDYRNTDARWTRSAQQQAAITARDAVALAGAPVTTEKPHRLRMWFQYEDMAAPVLTRDGMFRLLNPYMWGGTDDPTEANFGSCRYSTLAYQMGLSIHKNYYGQSYTNFATFPRSGVDVFPNPNAQAATWSAHKWYGKSFIVASTHIDPHVFNVSGKTDVQMPGVLSIVGS